jgi:hypothetical protein
MVTNAEKAQTVWWYAELGSIIGVQRRFRAEYYRNPLDDERVKEWKAAFLETGSVAKRHDGGRAPTSEEHVQRIADAFARSPKKSVRTASRELALPKFTVHDVLHKRLKLCAYKLQLLHEVKPDDKPKRATFAAHILQRMEIDNILANVLFSDEATFHLWEYVKNIVYATKVTSVEQLCERICGAIETDTPQMLQATWREIEYRLDILRATRGAHIEMY